tara:strand:+ start:219 stop:1169 length:951 start_codon:yes stop_codon:yes gene_type:complete
MKKIFFSFNPPEGSYGGGSFFVKNFVNFLKLKKYIITFKLEENIDFIFIIDPRKRKKYNKKYSLKDFINYKKCNPNTKIIHRVNDCDLKRNSDSKLEPLMIETMKKSDFVIFVSNWMKLYYHKKYNLNLNCSSIINGCDSKIFFPNFQIKDFKNKKIKIVTHHFSDNYLKGFEIYNQIDKLLNNNNCNFTFTFVGNYNKDYQPKNIKLLKATQGIELANIIRDHDIYLTATQFEPGAMHYVEGLSCGLPILFRKNGGGAFEVCNKCGLEFNNMDDFLIKLKLLVDKYDIFRNNIDYFFLSSKRCSEEYYKLIEKIN